MIEELSTVALKHEAGAGYTVEFATLSGETVAVATLTAEQVRPTRPNDIAHARELAVAP